MSEGSNVVPLRPPRDPGSAEPDPPVLHAPAVREDRSPAGGEDRSSADLVGPVLEGELVEDGPVPVDGPGVPATYGPVWERSADRARVVPAWIVDRDTRRAATKWAAGSVWHTARFHAVRSPVYAVRLAGASPRGAARAAAGAVRWASDAEYGDLIRSSTGDGKAAARLAEIRQSRARSRTVRLALAAGTAVLGLGGLVLAGPGWTRTAVLAVLVAVLGLIGRRKDKPIVTHAVQVQAKAPRLTSDQVVAALGSVGVKAEQVTFPAPITRDGPGWRADVDLPLGVTAADIMERRAGLASGLRRALGCVWPEPDHAQHAGRLLLWVGDQAMSEAKPPPWPLAKAGQVDLFRPVPFGYDQRMRLVTVLLMFANVLIGAIPGTGKTFALRVLLLAAALDPRGQLRLFELKGTGDLSVFERIAHHYGSGPSDEVIAACVASLREVYGLLESRAKTIAGLPRALCPENKVTPQLADQRRLGLFPIVFAVDECQELFSHPEVGKEADTLCTAIIKRGRALGIILLLATQRPDKNSLPTGISANVSIRFCLKVMGHTENDMVLGTGMHRNGIRATMLTTRDKGIGWLVGASDEPQIARSAYMDALGAERIVGRAHALREAAGTLTGYAVGHQGLEVTPTHSVVEDLVQVFGPMEEQAHSDDLCIRLADAWPDRYDGWGPRQLTAALEPHGVKADQVWARALDGKDRNRYGLKREWLLTTLERRNRPDDSPAKGPR